MSGYNLKKFFASPFSPSLLPWLLFLFEFLGFLDMAYLTISHYQNVSPPCTIHGCELVLTSQFSTILGIPVSLLGMLYFLFLLILTGIYVQTRIKAVSLILFAASVISLGVSILLVSIQAFILHAFCQYCLFAELMFFLIFDACWWLWNSIQGEITTEE